MVADMEIDKAADIEVNMVADMVAMADINIDIDIDIQFGERVDHGSWLIGPKLFRPKAYASCASSKLCKFIVWLEIKSVQGKYEPDCSFKLN